MPRSAHQFSTDCTSRVSGEEATDFENLKKGFSPRQLGKRGSKRIEQLAEELIREGYILAKITSYGYHVSLNPRRNAEIQKIIDRFVAEH